MNLDGGTETRETYQHQNMPREELLALLNDQNRAATILKPTTSEVEATRKDLVVIDREGNAVPHSVIRAFRRRNTISDLRDVLTEDELVSEQLSDADNSPILIGRLDAVPDSPGPTIYTRIGGTHPISSSEQTPTRRMKHKRSTGIWVNSRREAFRAPNRPDGLRMNAWKVFQQLRKRSSDDSGLALRFRELSLEERAALGSKKIDLLLDAHTGTREDMLPKLAGVNRLAHRINRPTPDADRDDSKVGMVSPQCGLPEGYAPKDFASFLKTVQSISSDPWPYPFHGMRGEDPMNRAAAEDIPASFVNFGNPFQRTQGADPINRNPAEHVPGNALNFERLSLNTAEDGEKGKEKVQHEDVQDGWNMVSARDEEDDFWNEG